jgi:hypothetical protein
MPGGIDDGDPSVVAERAAFAERPKRPVVKREGLGIKPGREGLTQDATHHPRTR